ncbi:MAG: ATP-dependent sacrificial sulfur transferase LarE [Methanobacteriota archaeon]
MKTQELVNWFRNKGSVVVALSGGVDSSVVAKAAFIALGEKAIAATAKSATLASSELKAAKKIAREIGITHEIFVEDEFKNPKFAENSPERCYHCRKGLTAGLKQAAKKYGAKHIVDGANADDASQHRPGLKAMEENGVRSPLMELGIGKEEVRRIAKHFDLSVSDKPSMACLASRIPYGERITKEKLRKIEEAEDFIRKLGFEQVRVRHHRSVARIEISEKDISKVLKFRKKILKKLKNNFTYVALDLEGYRSGSMDEVL